MESCALQVKPDIKLQGLKRCCCGALGSAGADCLGAVRKLLTSTEALLPSQTKQSSDKEFFCLQLFFLPVVRQAYQSITQAATCKSWHTLCLPSHILVYSL